MSNNTRTHNWVFHNGTAALSNGNVLSVGKDMVTATIEVTGTGTSTVIFEGKSSDDATYYPIMGVNLSDYTFGNNTSVKGVIYQVPLDGLVSFRVRVSSFSSGTVTAKATIIN